MAIVLRSLHFLVLVYVSYTLLALAQDETGFIYNGFRDDQANLSLDGLAKIHPNGLLQLTNLSRNAVGHAFYQFPMKFNTTSSLSFSTNFVFAMVPAVEDNGGQGIAFTISPSRNFSHAEANRYLGLFNDSNDNSSANHILAIELNPVPGSDFGNITDHVGIDVNSIDSVEIAPATYFTDKEGKNISLELTSGKPMHLWIDYNETEKFLNVTLAPTTIPKPNRPLLSRHIDLSQYLLESMYVGFSSATGTLASDHYILGWSFNKSGPSQSLDVSSLPPLPKRKETPSLVLITSFIAVAIVLITVAGAVAYILRRKKYEELREDWEEEYGPHRFSYKNLHKATKGFKDTELLGEGGFGKVYIGTLPSNVQIAVKRVSHDSKQGMKEFVAEIVSMGRLRHRNLVQLLGYCRRRGELLLVYDYMPNGSLDRFLYGNKKPNLNWAQRFRIIRGVASGLLYLHEEWEQVVLHRDVKSSNILLDAELNGKLGDFGLARLHDHGTNPQTTSLVGTVGYLAPELYRTGRATTFTDVFAFGAFILEVACGRMPLKVQAQGQAEQVILVDWVTECCRRGAILDTSDPRLEGNYVVEEMELVLKLGLLCSHAIPSARPSMKQVVQFLDGDADLRELPHYNASFDAITSKESYDFLSFPFSQASAPSMSSTDSFVRGGR
ncbi:L-type lectin-domain containing receptor kinase SIT2-like [Alnus glutinosa]|uniref:L-type lectin-domain containing receptor kinase SIT2-like n=1 Tax=Alnus glutinosa TaxID=3517 RepID=UPI002D78975A|nr:L-type lectin-domain containing receptor kinase SIT2-like [Alnus glutinosa]